MSSVTPSAQYRLTIRIEIDDAAGTLAHLTGAIGEAGGIVVAVDAVEIDSGHSVRDIVVDACNYLIELMGRRTASARRVRQRKEWRAPLVPVVMSCSA